MNYTYTCSSPIIFMLLIIEIWENQMNNIETNEIKARTPENMLQFKLNLGTEGKRTSELYWGRLIARR